MNAKPTEPDEPPDLAALDYVPPYKTTTPALTIFVRVVNAGAWLLLLPAVVVCGVLFVAALKDANGAPQEAAIGAVFSTILIGLYVAVRCVEKLAAVVERVQG